MSTRELYNKLFTEYPGHVGYAPAVLTLAISLAVAAAVGVGGYTIGKEFLANTVEGGHS